MKPISTLKQFKLKDILQSMEYTPVHIAAQLMNNLVQYALKGMVIWKNNLIYTLEAAVKLIDQQMSNQLKEIMHHTDFLTLEGRWRGLYYLVKRIDVGSSLKIKALNASKKLIADDLSQAVEIDRSFLFKKIYEDQFGTPGGEPYSLIVLDDMVDHSPKNVAMLSALAKIASAAFCPLIVSAAPTLFGFSSWQTLPVPRDLAKQFDGLDYIAWRSLRQSDDSRFLILTLPRVLARLPYGGKYLTAETFCYEEAIDSPLLHHQYCWMNAAYVYAERISYAFSRYGWCTAIRGMEAGGKVDSLPACTFMSCDGDMELKCPTEIGITDRREAELSRLGFLPLCHYKNTNFAVFFGAETLHQPKLYDSSSATNNAKISARLPYLMAVSRFTHYLKIIARDKVGAFMEREEISSWLNRWIINYVNGNAQASKNLKAKYPLAEAKITVTSIEGSPGTYNIIAWLRPWLHLEELTASIRLVTRIPRIHNR